MRQLGACAGNRNSPKLTHGANRPAVFFESVDAPGAYSFAGVNAVTAL
jgi:hypothetical protein